MVAWRRVVVGMAALASVVVVGCGGSGDSPDDDGGGVGGELGGAEPEARSHDEPVAVDGTDVRPFVEQLLADHDTAVNEITADPEVARDPDGPAVRRYVELYEPGSAVPDQVVASWAEMADGGQRVTPLDPDTPPAVTQLDGEVEVVSEDEVRFLLCVRQRLLVVDVDGQPVGEPSTAQRPGSGVAVRVDGRWFLRQLDTFTEGACHTVVVAERPEGES